MREDWGVFTQACLSAILHVSVGAHGLISVVPGVPLSPFAAGLFDVGAALCVYATEREGREAGQHYLLEKKSGFAY